jgi:hypothetical protein
VESISSFFCLYEEENGWNQVSLSIYPLGWHH